MAPIFFAAGMGVAMYLLASVLLIHLGGFYIAGGASNEGLLKLVAILVAAVNAVGGLVFFTEKLPFQRITLFPFLILLNALALIICAYLVPDFAISGFGDLLLPAAILGVVGVGLKSAASKMFPHKKVSS